jgi:hypothetical protein
LKIILLFLILLTSCKPTNNSTTSVTPTNNTPTVSYKTNQTNVSKYLTKFQEEYLTLTGSSIDLSNLSFSITASLNNSSEIGSCVGSQVSLQQSFWFSETTTNSQREQLVFHELKHCALLYQSHNNNTTTSADTNQTVPVSIMNENPISDSLYRRNRTYYIKQIMTSASSLSIYVNNADQFPESYYQ